VACIPETPTDIPQIIEHLKALQARGKKSIIVIVAEGDELGGVVTLAEKLSAANCPFETRAVVLGHLQRGGSPVAADRILATRLGDFAVRAVLEGHTGAMTGEISGKLVLTPFPGTFARHNPVPPELVALLETTAT
jgi:6-phosphofructokinase 1